ncbi:MAG: hypothetical protein LBH42_04330 [Treponema sp.]|jgi:hypothetical protein|nr:hypothetical protein [Treponema sp.]
MVRKNCLFVLILLSGLLVFACQNESPNDPDYPRDPYYGIWSYVLNISAEELHFFLPDMEYVILNPKWKVTSIPKNDLMKEDLSEFKTGYPYGFSITGKVIQIAGIYPGNGKIHTEYVFIDKDDSSSLLWYNPKMRFMIFRRE